LCKKIYDVLKSADVLVTHNGKKFDIKVIQSRLYIHGLSLLPKIPHADTRQLAKRHLFLFNNKLDNVARSTGVQKIKHEGWPLWEKVSKKDKKAMALMTKYCKKDVVVLEAAFKKMLPFVSDLPNYNILRKDGVECCPSCGGFDSKKDGPRIMKNYIDQRWKCKECGAYCSTKLEKKNKNKNYPKGL